jgi:sortase (surface protein transpeptidase)
MRVTGVRHHVVAALLVALALTGCARAAELPQRAYGALVNHFNEWAAARSPVAEQVPAEVRRFRSTRTRARIAAPARIEIPSIGVRSELDRLDLQANGTIAPPPKWQTAGWYRRGAKPGQRGPAVILGHVDSNTGPAVFHRLRELAIGDVIRIISEDGAIVRFAVQRSAHYPKARFPTGDVYLPTPEPTLRLITCGGTFDRAAGRYRKNLVVFAELIGDGGG